MAGDLGSTGAVSEEARTTAARMSAIAAYDALAGEPRRDLGGLVALAAHVARVPRATINIITDEHQHQVATYGFDGSAAPKEESFCVKVVEDGRAVLLEDASQDPRFRDNPNCNGQQDTIRFYAAHPLVTPEGVVIGTLCVFDVVPREITTELRDSLEVLAERVMDVLALDLARRHVAEANVRLALANERLATFAGQVGHDLVNPLSSVVMAVELALESTEDVRERGLLERAHRGALRSADMVRELLEYARGGAHAAAQDVDLATIVEEVCEDLQDVLAAGAVEVAALPVVTGDPVHLRLLVQNLLANAAKFAHPDRPIRIRLGAEQVDGGWRIEVADNGVGIPADERERVFSPRVRLDHGLDGHGLGLATCHRIVGAHGGQIGVTETPGGGATFWFWLPSGA